MKTWIVVAATCGMMLACSKSGNEPRLEKQAPTKPAVNAGAGDPSGATPSAPTTEKSAPEPAKEPSHDAPPPPAGWSAQLVTDEVPLCIFSDYVEREKAAFINQVTKQKLKADTAVVFGAFAPRCLHRECDDDPTLQAWLDEEGENTFVVHSRFHVLHKDGATCTKNCERVIAGVQTRDLKPGTYTVKYGKLTRQFTVPGVLKSPCLTAK